MTINKPIPKPFLRWAGGKSWLIKYLPDILPKKFNKYYEPFLGGGAVFFYLKGNGLLKGSSVLSDINQGLIESYKILRDSPLELINELKRYNNTEQVYYSERKKNYDDPIKSAARFIFLNRTSFNGIYRENLQGVYNVPYGHKSYKTLFDSANLLHVSSLLRRVTLKTQDFDSSIAKAKEGDLLFLDPPYTVAHENNGFVKYNQNIFSWEDQIRLKDSLIKLNEKGAYFIITNAFHKSLLNLYADIGTPYKLERVSVVGGANAKREKYNELILTNAR